MTRPWVAVPVLANFLRSLDTQGSVAGVLAEAGKIPCRASLRDLSFRSL